MTIIEMLGQSGVLTLLGMGVVFGFLVILVIIVSLAGKIIGGASCGGETLALVHSAPKAAPASNEGQVTAAITAAISEYRKNH